MIFIIYGRKINVDGEDIFQTLEDHVNGVIRRSKEYSKNTPIHNVSVSIATLHDVGKIPKNWQIYLKEGGPKIPHSAGGMYLAKELIDELEGKISKDSFALLHDIVEYVIGAHHGPFDLVKDGNLVIESRIMKFASDKEALEGIAGLFDLFPRDKVKSNLLNAGREIDDILEIIKKSPKSEKGYLFYSVGVIVRILLSIQIDSDWSDAADFEFNRTQLYEKEFEDFDWDNLVNRFEDYIAENFTSVKPINKLRSKISQECKENALRDEGIYRMFVPTGGGKTFAAMRFALHHSKKHKKDRIFYIAPFNSILEQNAWEYREAFGELSEKYLLEHHSNVVIEDFGEENTIDYDVKAKFKYLTEKWTSPIILTSMVQLLNSFFSGNKKAIRRLHRLKNSVIIIDELQAVPLKCITIFNLFLNTLSKYFNVTFVLCTATQPPYERILGDENASKKTAAINYAKEKELVRNYENMDEFKRVQILNKTKLRPYDLEDMTDLIEEEAIDTNNILMIGNTRSIVDKLFLELKNNQRLSEFKIMMLSNDMCPSHRLEIIKSIKENLEREKIILLSTPLIEAGVNLSFEKVIRSLTGLDSIAQAAGRCNRHKEKDLGDVILINIDPKLENVSMLEEIKIGQEITHALLNDFDNSPEKYDYDLLSMKAIEIYFSKLHEELSEKTHYDTKDGETLYDLLGRNLSAKRDLEYNNVKIKNRYLKQAFATAGKEFKAIEDASDGILVPFGEGEEIINKLMADSTKIDEYKELISKVQHYTVGVYSNVLEKLKAENGVTYVEEYNFYIVAKNYYDEERGLVLEENIPETSII